MWGGSSRAEGQALGTLWTEDTWASLNPALGKGLRMVLGEEKGIQGWRYQSGHSGKCQDAGHEQREHVGTSARRQACPSDRE